MSRYKINEIDVYGYWYDGQILYFTHLSSIITQYVFFDDGSRGVVLMNISIGVSSSYRDTAIKVGYTRTLFEEE